MYGVQQNIKTHTEQASKEAAKKEKKNSKKKGDSWSSDKTICRIRLNNDADVRASRQVPHGYYNNDIMEKMDNMPEQIRNSSREMETKKSQI